MDTLTPARPISFFAKSTRRWIAGANLFSSCEGETEEDQRRKYDEIGIGGFREVKPLKEGTPVFQRGLDGGSISNEAVRYAGAIVSTAIKTICARDDRELEQASHHIATVNGDFGNDPSKDAVALIIFQAVEAEMNRRKPNPPYREELDRRIVKVVADSIGGSPWTEEVETALSGFKAGVDCLIDADPTLKEIFDTPQHGPWAARDSAVPF